MADSVARRLLAAQKSVDAVVKRGENTGQGYRFAQASDVLEVCRKALHDADLVGFISEVSNITLGQVESKSGSPGAVANVTVTLTVAAPGAQQASADARAARARGEAAPPVDTLTFTASGSGIDYPGDKAIYKAQTGATKYAYANALALPFADHDPERDIPGEAARPPKPDGGPVGLISAGRVDEIGKALAKAKQVGVPFERVALAFGSVGADAPKMDRGDSKLKAVRKLTDEQATKLADALTVETAKAGGDDAS